MAVLGLDIGGANIKAADGTGRAFSRAFPIWSRPTDLSNELVQILNQFPDCSRIAVTMTAELADCFSTKREGVGLILKAVGDAAQQLSSKRDAGGSGADPHQSIHVWSVEGQFVSITRAMDDYRKVAAANWHVLATWCAEQISAGAGLLIDIGTTTTDIIPIVDRRPAAVGATDLGRLQSAELSYSGVWRTPLCAIAHSVPFRDGYCSIAAELFATTLDVYLLLGQIPEDPSNFETANGKPATREAAYDRVARMLCCDRNEMTYDEAVAIARFLADVQRQRLAGSLERVARRLPSNCQTVIISGSGSFLANALTKENRHTASASIVSLADRISPDAATAACAYALARLADEHLR